MFYWIILHKSGSELLRQFYKTQELSPVRNDWCLQIYKDLNDCNIHLTESEITNMKKSKFKNLLIKGVNQLSSQYLLELKEKHSKSDGLSANNSPQSYLTSNGMTTQEKQLLFQFRTRTYPCKTNFRTFHGDDLSCSICQEEDNSEHLLHCSRITAGIDTSGVSYRDIFGSLSKQIKIVKILKKIDINRKKILSTSNMDGGLVHPQ